MSPRRGENSPALLGTVQGWGGCDITGRNPPLTFELRSDSSLIDWNARLREYKVHSYSHCVSSLINLMVSVDVKHHVYLHCVSQIRVRELCETESRAGRPGLSVLMSLLVSVDVKQH